MAAHVLTLVLDLHLPSTSSLKDKRAVVRTVLDGARNRYRVAVAETEHQDLRQRAELTFVAVSGAAGHVAEVIDDVERFVWSFPELEVLGATRLWLDHEP